MTNELHTEVAQLNQLIEQIKQQATVVGGLIDWSDKDYASNVYSTAFQCQQLQFIPE